MEEREVEERMEEREEERMEEREEEERMEEREEEERMEEREEEEKMEETEECTLEAQLEWLSCSRFSPRLRGTRISVMMYPFNDVS